MLTVTAGSDGVRTWPADCLQKNAPTAHSFVPRILELESEMPVLTSPAASTTRAASPSPADWIGLRDELLGKRIEQSLPPWVKLPCLPTAVMQFVSKAQNPEAGPAELGDIIARDSGLSCILLRHVNASASGFGQQCGTAREAVTRLGIRSSLLFFVSHGMKEVMKAGESKLMNIPAFWCANLERALFARAVARELKVDAELAYSGAMLSDCLLPLLTSRASKSYVRYLSPQEKSLKQLTDFETTIFGWDHATATALLLHGWNFPADLVCCVYLHHRGVEVLDQPQISSSAAAAVAIAGLLPDQMKQAPDGLKQLQSLEERWPNFNLLETAEEVQAEFEQSAPGVVNPFPLLRRLRSR